MFNLPRMNRNIGGRRNTVHFLFFLTRFQFLTAKTVLISFDNFKILSIRSRSPAQRFHHSRANQTTLEHRRPKLTIREINRINDLCKRMNDLCKRMSDLCKRIEWDVTA